MVDKHYDTLLQLTRADVAKFEANNLNKYNNDMKVGRRCEYGFIYEDGEYGRAHWACHSAMAGPNSGGYIVEGYQPASQVKACVNFFFPGKNIPEILKQWLVDPVVSPWKDLMQKDFYALRTTNDDLCVIVGDLSHSSLFITSYFKAMRMYAENHRNGATCTALLERGIHPVLAVFFGQLFSLAADNKTLSALPGGWHGSFFSNYSQETLKNFINGEYKNNGKPYGLGNYGYYGVDTIFGSGDRFATDFTNKYKVKDSTVARAFGEAVRVPGWNIDKLVEICQELEKDYGLKAYRYYGQPEPTVVAAPEGPAKASVPRRRAAGVRGDVAPKRVRANKAA